jgi:hypothetical protein
VSDGTERQRVGNGEKVETRSVEDIEVGSIAGGINYIIRGRYGVSVEAKLNL